MSEIKVGDTVKILGGTEKKYWNPNGEMDWTIGESGIVKKVDTGMGSGLLRYIVRINGSEEEWVYNRKDLLLLLEEKEENIIDELTLTNLTEEQKKQIIELAKKFEQENETDKLDYYNDYEVASQSREVGVVRKYNTELMNDFFNLGLTAHTKEEAEKIRRRLLVEKELRDWAKKCKEPVDFGNDSLKYSVCYSGRSKELIVDSFCYFTTGNIIFTDERILKQAIESIGQERLIRDYFGIEREEK